MNRRDFTEKLHRTDDGLRLYYRDYGSAAGSLPILCLPGLTRNCRDFEALTNWLAPHWRVLTPDLRGRGRSDYDRNWTRYTPYQYVRDMFGLLDALAIDRVVCVGTSLGGLMTAIMNFERPGIVAAAVLNDVGPELEADGLARIVTLVGTQAVVDDWDAAIAATRALYEPALPDIGDDVWSWYAHNMYREIEDGHIDLNFDRNIGTALRRGVSGLAHDGWALFDALRDVPVLALRGALSDVLSRETLMRMLGRYPGMTGLNIGNRGHVPLLNEPEAKDGIGRFLDALRAPD